MSWNYRVIKTQVDEAGQLVDWFAIHEVYYREKDGGEDYDNIKGWTSNAIDVTGESVDDIRSVLDMMAKALDKPVLDEGELRRFHNPVEPVLKSVETGPIKHLGRLW